MSHNVLVRKAWKFASYLFQHNYIYSHSVRQESFQSLVGTDADFSPFSVVGSLAPRTLQAGLKTKVASTPEAAPRCHLLGRACPVVPALSYHKEQSLERILMHIQQNQYLGLVLAIACSAFPRNKSKIQSRVSSSFAGSPNFRSAQELIMKVKHVKKQTKLSTRRASEPCRGVHIGPTLWVSAPIRPGSGRLAGP